MKKAFNRIFIIISLMFVLLISICSRSAQKSMELLQNIHDNFENAIRYGKFNSEDIGKPPYFIKKYDDNLFFKDFFVNISGRFITLAGINDYYRDKNVFLTEGDYLISRYASTNCDYEIAQMKALKEAVNKSGGELLYINIPMKYADDSLMLKEFGVETFSNRNSDIFLKRLQDEGGIEYIDLRENLKQENKDLKENFYRTEHHWTSECALWACGIVAERLSDDLAGIPLNIFERTNYNFIKHEASWLGEQGKLFGALNMGKEDYVEIIPKYATDYTIISGDDKTEGDFESIMINDKVMGYYHNKEYLNERCINNNSKNSLKLLLIHDSMSVAFLPIMINAVNEIDLIHPRIFDGNICEYVKEGDYDAVIVMFTPSAIGAHDDENSLNYQIFSFDGK